MLVRSALVVAALSACAATSQQSVTTIGTTAAGLADYHCSGVPVAPASDDDDHLRHASSHLVIASGDPRHRGIDVITSAGTQTLTGIIAYSHFDKALEDEDVEVFACDDAGWTKLGTARTNEEGRFTIAAQLPVGMRDLYASVVGDRSGARFLAYVAPEGSPLVVSDVDGTLTSSENEFLETVTADSKAEVQPRAAQALQALAAAGKQVVYVTARGNYYTEDTRTWLDSDSFPRGPLRLAPDRVTLPGADTVTYKTNTFIDLGFPIFAGIGNRDSDITAYTNAGVDAAHIFIKLPEYAGECQADLDADKAIGFSDYDALAGIALR
jgi:hypothetical protein